MRPPIIWTYARKGKRGHSHGSGMSGYARTVIWGPKWGFMWWGLGSWLEVCALCSGWLPFGRKGMGSLKQSRSIFFFCCHSSTFHCVSYWLADTVLWSSVDIIDLQLNSSFLSSFLFVEGIFSLITGEIWVDTFHYKKSDQRTLTTINNLIAS